MTIQTIHEYLSTESFETLQDICTHGMSAGFLNLIYYKDTVAFHDEHEEEIWNMLYEEAEAQGITILQLITSFNGSKDVGSMHQFKNLLCWYSIEYTAQQMLNELELTANA